MAVLSRRVEMLVILLFATMTWSRKKAGGMVAFE